MLALIAIVIFVLAAAGFHPDGMSTLAFVAVGLAVLAAHLLVPWMPWTKSGD